MTIRSDFQTTGKGKHGNSWQAEERKNLLFTTILDTKGFQLHDQFLLNAFACLSVADYLMTNADIRNVTIKWPNDIYAENKKIAGILIENIIRGSTWTHAIIGIGLNVNQTYFPDMHWATSMQLETGKTVKINLLMKELLKSMNIHFTLVVIRMTVFLATETNTSHLLVLHRYLKMYHSHLFILTKSRKDT